MLFDNNEENYYNTCYEQIETLINVKSYSEIFINDLKIGQTIFVTFSPDSQKYIYTLYPKCGYVHSIKRENLELESNLSFDNLFKIELQNLNNELEPLLHEPVGSMYGYIYNIYLIS